MLRKDDTGAIWIKEKIKEKNGKQIRTRYLSFYVKDEQGNKKWYVAFASGKKADGNAKYPDFIIYAQQRDSGYSQYQSDNKNNYYNEYYKGPYEDELKPKKLEELENEENNDDDDVVDI